MAHTAGDPRRAADERKLIQQCQMIAGDKARLACFDDAAKQLAPPRFQGRLGHITEPFKLTSPHRLRFKSYGAIFVLYLRGDKGQVLQNLHLGGGGEDSYEIKKPGTYSLKIHGSAAWAIWLEPLELAPNNH
ncbi:MAG: hypothetical protein DHS20C08_16750 [Rhodomicrobium sp.]|nr:MAG: hypothetical protein DHS20C08_16750 [Rhodomicrobium sp.]